MMFQLFRKQLVFGDSRDFFVGQFVAHGVVDEIFALAVIKNDFERLKALVKHIVVDGELFRVNCVLCEALNERLHYLCHILFRLYVSLGQH